MVTIVSPVSRNGVPRPGTSNQGGALLKNAEKENAMEEMHADEDGWI